MVLTPSLKETAFRDGQDSEMVQPAVFGFNLELMLQIGTLADLITYGS
jgi:hypothetical protein